MKYLIFILFLLLQNTDIKGQNEEFTTHSNGLIYSDTTMKQLAFIIDSLNLKFRSCGLDKVYKSKLQARAHYVYFEKGNVIDAKMDIEANIPFEDFINKYRSAEIEKDLLVVKFKYENYNNEKITEFSSVPFGGSREHEIDVNDNWKRYSEAVKDKWVLFFSEKSKWSDAYLYGFFFTSEFENQPLSEDYARLVQYSDCMVDTTSLIFSGEC